MCRKLFLAEVICRQRNKSSGWNAGMDTLASVESLLQPETLSFGMWGEKKKKSLFWSLTETF